ncbi:hypothetical protein WJX74_000798 [Apatococcus lobatus]|uniref:CCR4-NOT transcription complex subunit 11 n=2 Tax=Apatococcus TaxID=904362 RepID=A0AAW1SIM4_9CHLO
MPLLSPQDTGALLALIRSARDKPLEATLVDFTATFGSGLCFQALAFAASILETGDDTRVADRLTGYFLLHTVPKASLGAACPLRALIGQVLFKPRRSLAEKTFAVRLLIKRQTQLGQLIPAQFVHTFDAATAATQSELQQLQTFLTEPPKAVSSSVTKPPGRTASKAASNAAATGGQEPGSSSSSNNAQTAALHMLQSLQLGGCPAPYILPPPPLLLPLEGEVRWMQPEVPYELLWDPAVERDGGRAKQVREQLLAATREPLVPTRQRDLLTALTEDSGLAQRCCIAPVQLPSLVEHNPNVAVQVLVQLLQTDRAPIFLQTLISMDLTLHSMEVVNRLTAIPEMPPDFLHLYISHCLSSCAQAKDKGVQNRLVRLVCVFLQSLVGKHFVAIQDLLVEIQSFCIEFSRFREAATLFRQLKQLQSDSAESNAGFSSTTAFSTAETNGKLDPS